MDEFTTDSTALDANDHSLAAGNGAPSVAEAGADDSIQSVLEAEFKSIRDAEEKPEAEPKGDDKAEKASKENVREPDEAKAQKAEKADKPAALEQGEPKQPAKSEPKSEPKQEDQPRGRYHEPPSKFLPDARTKWANVPNEIKSEFHRVTQEYENEVAEHRQFREEIREYEDLARQNGVTIKDTMARYVEADRALNQDFGRGVAQIAQMYGHNPAQAIAAVMQGFGITPQQYIQAVTQNPQLAQARAPQMQPQQAPEPRQPQIDPEKLTSQIKAQLRAEMTAEQTVSQFASSRPDFGQLAPQIKGILDSGVIDRLYGSGLSYEDKLAEAYRMAGGSGLTSNQGQQAIPAHSEQEARPVNPDAGKKSVRGAPSNGEDAASDETETDLRDLLKKEMKKLVA